MAVKRCLGMSHTQLDYQLAFGFYSNFPTSILISISWYYPGVLPWMEFYTIRTRYSLRHRFKDRLSTQKEYFKFLVQITLKIDGFFLAMSEHCRYTRVPKDGNRRVGSPTSRFAYKLIRLHSCKSIRLHDLTNRLCYSLSMYYI